MGLLVTGIDGLVLGLGIIDLLLKLVEGNAGAGGCVLIVLALLTNGFGEDLTVPGIGVKFGVTTGILTILGLGVFRMGLTAFVVDAKDGFAVFVFTRLGAGGMPSSFVGFSPSFSGTVLINGDKVGFK